ncbi:lysine-rich arabinogalactan protein 19 isoform X2 [Triticum aestivum]|nr:lysine-rich arabinogalactan protein 19-like isoform X2 [Triticum aestivum]
MEQGAGKKLGKAKASKYDVKASPQSEVSALELPGAPTRAEVAALQLPGAPPSPTQPEVDTTSQATALQLPGARPQPPQAEVSPRPLTIVPAPAHLPPQADAVWFRSLLEALRLRFPGPVVARIFEAFQGAWASVHGWWSGPPPAAAPVINKKNKNKKKDKNKNTLLPVPRRSKAWLYWEKRRRRRVIPPPPVLDEPQPSQPAPVPLIIDGETVPAEIVEGYKR